MKKIILVLTLIFSFTLSYGNEISKIDKTGIIKIFKQNGFSSKSEGDYIFLRKRKGKVEEKVTVFLFEDKVYSIDLISNHFHVSPNKLLMEKNLKDMINLLKTQIKSNEFNSLITKAFNDIEKESFGIVESDSGIIRTTNLKTEKSLSIGQD